jgi:hypothetical protein
MPEHLACKGGIRIVYKILAGNLTEGDQLQDLGYY